ncbi:MAG: MFS transporter [Beduini sp.]
MKYYQKNMFFNYVYEFLLNLDFSRIIWPTYLILKGYNLIDVGICESIFHVTSFICEMPTGAISDLYGRRFSRLCGRIIHLFSLICLLFAQNIFYIYLSFILSALSYNMESGTDSAYVYDLMKSQNKEKTFAKVQGYREMIIQIAMLGGVMIGGFLTDRSYQLTYFISIILGVVTIFILMQTSEIKNHHYVKQKIFKSMIGQYQTSISLLKKNHNILLLMLCQAIFSDSLTTFHYYLTNYYKGLNIQMSHISMILSLENIAGILGGLVTYRIMQKLSQRSILIFIPLMIVLSAFFIPVYPFSIIALVTMGFSESIIYVSTTTFLNQLIESQYRATLLSCSSMIFSLVMIIFFPLVGLFGDVFSLKTAFFILAGFLVLNYVIYVYFVEKVRVH